MNASKPTEKLRTAHKHLFLWKVQLLLRECKWRHFHTQGRGEVRWHDWYWRWRAGWRGLSTKRSDLRIQEVRKGFYNTIHDRAKNSQLMECLRWELSTEAVKLLQQEKHPTKQSKSCAKTFDYTSWNSMANIFCSSANYTLLHNQTSSWNNQCCASRIIYHCNLGYLFFRTRLSVYFFNFFSYLNVKS